MALIQLDTRLGWLNSSLISFNQLSVGTSKLEFEITENNQPKDLTDLRVMIEIKTPSGSVQEEHVTIIDSVSGKIEKDLSAPMLTEEGSHYGELSLYSQDNTKLLCTPKFRYIVGSNYGEQVVKQTSQYATLQTCIMEVKDLEKEVGNNIEEIEISKNLAEQAKNEAEQSKVESMQSASNSIQSSIAAERSAESALETSSTLDQVVEMAKQSAEASKQSASSSQASADAAERAKDVALQSVEQSNAASKTANQASVNAEQALRDAIVSKDTAKQAETSATTSANEASKAEASASNSKAILEQKIQEIVAVKEVVDNTVSTANTAVEQANGAINAAETLTAENKNLILTAVQTTNRAEDAIANANTANQTANQKLIDTTEQANIAKEQVQLAKDEVTKAQTETTKATEQATVAKLKSEEATTQANRAAEEANKAGAQAQEKVNSKIGHNGVFDDTNFNFIENKVVQDGLLYSEHNKVKNKEMTKELANSIFYLNTTFTQDFSETGYVSYGIRQFAQVHIRKNIFTVKLKNPEGTVVDGIYQTTLVKNTNQLEMYIVNNTLTIILNNKNLGVFNIYPLGRNQLIDIANGSGKESYCENVFLYSRLLTQQEIQHNISVLNNSQSIKELHTTDSTGKTSILKLASDEDHVEMASGRTLREEYMGVLKTMGKEFTSADGSPIQVPNGIEARIIDAEIKGQTVKNYAPAWVDGFTTSYQKNKDRITISEYDGQVASSGEWIKQLKPNTNYTVFINVLENTCTRENIFMNNEAAGALNTALVKIGAKQTGWLSFDFTTKETFDKWVWTVRASSGETLVAENPVIVERVDKNKVIKYIPFGLSSTEAIISNNGQQYPIYEPTIQGKTRILDADTGLVPTDPTLPALKDGDVLDLATRTITFANKTTRVLTDEEVKAYSAFKKVISLPFAEDKVMLNEDGSATWVDTNEKLKLDNTLDWKTFVYENGYGRCALILNNAITGKTNERILADTAHVVNWSDVSNTKVDRFISNTDGAKDLILYIKDATTIENYKQNLETNPINIIYKATPVTSPLDKSIMPTILTHNQTNILEVGGAVKPSSFKVTVPVDAIGELRAEINEIKKQLGAVAALQLGQIN